MAPQTYRPMVLPDCRDALRPMAPLPLKIPPAAVDRLQAQSERLRCHRAALARTLLLQGLERLEAATAAREVA